MHFNIDTAIFILAGLGALAVLLPIIYSQREKIEEWGDRDVD